MQNHNLFRYSKTFFVISVILTVFFVSYIPKVRNVENVDHFLLKDDPDNLFYEEFKTVFGNDEFFIISITAENIFTKETLTVCREITESLEKIEDIKDVKSLTNIDETRGYDDFFEVRKLIQEIPESKEQLSDIRDRALTNNLFLKNLISEDGRTTAILVELYEKPDDDRYRHRIMAKTHDILSYHNDSDLEFHLAGKTVTDTTMSDFMEKDVSFFIPLSYLLISFCLFYFFRSVKLTILGILNISFSLGSTMGFMGFMGITQNSVTSVVLPLIMAFALCDTVHLYSGMTRNALEKNHFDRTRSIRAVLEKIIWPCFLTSLTTIIGFSSLYVNKLQPIKEFSMTAVAGIIFVFIYTFFLLPPLITLFDPKTIYKDYHKANFVNFILTKITKLVVQFKIGIMGFGAAVFLVSFFFSFQIKMETNIMKFFKSESDIRQSMAHIESNLAGIEAFDISLQTKIDEGFKNPEHLKVIEDIEKYLLRIKSVDKTISFNDFIKDMNKSFHNENQAYYKIPESRELISQYLLLYDSDDIGDYINTSYDHARITVRISEHSSTRQKQMLEQIKSYIDSIETSDLEIRVTGRVLQDVNVIEDLFWGQLKSLGLAIITIWVLLFLIFRSFALGCLSLIPNILPIIVNFGIMGALGIPLNTATALIAAVAIGVAVDDTIHFMVEYQRLRKFGKTPEDLIGSVIRNKGRAILSSSIILCIGFGVLSFSSFVPTVHFGFLCAIIMFSALVADLIILPAVLLNFEKNIIVRRNC